jgi:type I restriction enzyme R subunit
LDYARILDIPCAFSSNGNGFFFHDRTAKNESIETKLSLQDFPSPQNLWQKYKQYKNIITSEADKTYNWNIFLMLQDVSQGTINK